MNPPRPEQFPEFFAALHHQPPYAWQRTLAERACRGDWPRALALPTASGKTACIDVAVFALACQAALPPAERTAPRRILFVVDRRVIVDQAFERAKQIAARLRDPKDSSILAQVAEALRAVAGLGSNEAPLDSFLLRGGIYRDHAWARTPTQPTVIASTVDQIGSRLLFRGYGVSESLWPIHAGLAANDSLILLDEAHCARPFLQTVGAIRDYRRWTAPAAPKTPFHLVVLSATPPEALGAEPGDVLELSDEDKGAEQLGPRLRAKKLVALVAESVPGGVKGQASFAAKLVEHARTLLHPPECRAVAVLVNRVKTARLVYKQLHAVKKWDAGTPDFLLLIGRMRPLDRDRLMDAWKPRLQANPERPPRERPIIVVATQCLEVGADFDFDGLVTECASLDALRQRFGRLNRLGRPIDARGAIVIRADQVRSEDEIGKEAAAKKDPIYEDALPRTWNWLQAPEDGAGPVIDFGIEALQGRLPPDPDKMRLLQAPALDAPIMLPAHVDCWAQTAPAPRPDPDVPLFLHGPEQGRPEVQVCWRGDLTVIDGDVGCQRRWIDAVALCPPAAAECMPVPLHIVRDWLAGAKEPLDDDGDLEQGRPPASPDDSPPQKSVLRWRGPDNPETRLTTDPKCVLRPGDTLVIPVAEGGWDTFGFIPGAGETEDADGSESDRSVDHGLAEEAQRRIRRRALLRLHPRLLTHWPAGGALETLRRIACDEEDPTEYADELRAALAELAQAEGCPPWLRESASSLAKVKRKYFKIQIHPDHPSNAQADLDLEKGAVRYPGGLVLVGTKPLPPMSDTSQGDDETTEDDTASASVYAPLADHCKGVARRVTRFARHCGLSRPLRRALTAAACWHDLGKADERFQVWLHDGDRLAARRARHLLAKSERFPNSPQERRRSRELSGYPAGSRHELVSVRLAEQLLDRLDPAVDRDLVLHLIASHHGCGRPFAPVVVDSQPETVSAQALGLPIQASSDTQLHRLENGVAERYWELVRRYGWWGLAWLEALLRLADHRQSEWEKLREGEATDGGR